MIAVLQRPYFYVFEVLLYICNLTAHQVMLSLEWKAVTELSYHTQIIHVCWISIYLSYYSMFHQKYSKE